MDSELPGYRAARRGRPDHPVEFPAADAGLEDRPGARDGQHRRPQARRVHLAHRAGLRRDLPTRSACRRAWSTSSRAKARRGEAIVEHPDIDKIAFTGSTDVGRHIRKATAGSGKKLSLELGGKSPFIVFEDADLDSVVEGVVDAIWFNQGRSAARARACSCRRTSPRGWKTKLRARMETLRVGDPLDKAMDMGAIVAPGAARADHAAGGAGRGRRRDACGSHRGPAPPRAASIRRRCSPTSRPASTVAQVEIFGPVLVSMTFRTPAEAVALANNTRYGLAASVWTREHQPRARRGPEDQGGHGLDQQHQPVRRGRGLRRLSRKRLRARGRQGRAVRVHTPAWETRAKSAARRRTKDHGSPRSERQSTNRTVSSTLVVAVHRSHAQALHRRQAGAPRFRL